MDFLSLPARASLAALPREGALLTRAPTILNLGTPSSWQRQKTASLERAELTFNSDWQNTYIVQAEEHEEHLMTSGATDRLIDF